MFNIFAALRRALRTSEPGGSLGEIARLAIVEDVIPRLRAMMDKADTPAEKQKLDELMALWKMYSDENSPDSRIWANIASKAMRLQLQKFRLNKDSIQDIESSIVEDFYSNPRYRTTMNTIDPKKGPDAAFGFWTAIVTNLAWGESRNFKRKEFEHGFGERLEDVEDGEGGRRPILDQLEDTNLGLTNHDVREMEIILDLLEKRIKAHFGHDELAMKVYEKWMELAKDNGPDEIVFDRDVSKALMQELKGSDIPASTSGIAAKWGLLKKDIVRFFESLHEGHGISRRVKEKLRVSERLARWEYRRRLAAWVLGVNLDN
jgi:hypothetical protein